jgi:hypothetical protein
MDANEYARSVKPAEKSLGVVIRSAQWLGSGTKPKLTTHCLNSVHQWVEADEVLPTAHVLPTVELVPTASSKAPETVADEILQSMPVLQIEPIESVAPTPDATGVLGATPVPGAAPVRGAAPILAAVPTATDPALTGHATATLPEPEAAAVPSLPPPEAEAKTDEQRLVIAFGERRYRVRGLPKQLGEALKVNVLVTLATSDALAPVNAAEAGLHVDTFDLYQSKARVAFAKLASIELRLEESVIQHDLGRLLLKLEQVIDERAKAAESSSVAPLPSMTPEETAAALAFLRDAQLIERTVSDGSCIRMLSGSCVRWRWSTPMRNP